MISGKYIRGLLILAFLLTTIKVNAQIKSDYPFPVNYLALKAQQNTYRMAYMLVKPTKPNGKTVVLLHGKNFNGAYWKTTAELLSENGFTVVIPDQIGFGKSSKPENFQYSFQQLSLNTKILLDSLKIQSAIVLGHSMGGMLATRFTLMYPEFVSQLVLVDPIGLEDYKLKVPYQSIDELYKKEIKQNFESLKKYQQENYYHGEWKPEYDQWLNFMVEQTMQNDYPVIAKNNALTTDMIMTQPVVYELQNIKASTLLIVGSLDKTALGKDQVSQEVQKTMGNYTELAEKTQRIIPDCELEIIEGAGHLPHIESFDKFSKALLDFLLN
ncbi:MAG: alpha/beta hydrolase [Bacteroidetes bacterium]|nr:alpha/beta hydrolase [Bacteroidota bacterium]MBK9415216.1 alpha/beta hydrolase [Bacteroidota bacterium]